MLDDTFCIFKHDVNPYSKTYRICSGIDSIHEIPKFNNHYVIVSGDIHNIPDIRREFLIDSAVVEEIISELYLRVGSSFLRYLEGIFVVIIIDSNKIVMARDIFSLGNVYFDFDNATHKFIISNKIREISRFRQLKVNTAVLPRYFVCSSICIGDTFFEDIRSLRPAELLEYYIDEDRLTSSLYDDSFYKEIRKERLKDDIILKESQHIVRDALQGILDYYSGYSAVNSLSGGVDSSYLQAILKELGHDRAYTYSFETISANVQQYAKDIARYLQIEHKIVEIGPGDIVDSIKKGISVCEAPFLFEGELLQNCMYHDIRNSERNNILIANGSGADTLFGADRPLLELEYLRNPLFLEMFSLLNESLLRIFRKKDHRRYRTIIRKLRNRTLDEEFVFSLFDRGIHEETIKKGFNLDNLCEVHSADIREIGEYDGDLSGKLERWYLIEYAIHRANSVSVALCKEYGLKICFPFVNRRLARYLLSIPMRKKLRGGITTKYYMKKMLSEHLPSKYVYRRKINYGTKKYLYFFKDDRIAGLIQNIKNTRYDYFSFDYEEIFSNEKYYGLAIKLVNFHIWHKIFIENVDVDDIH